MGPYTDKVVYKLKSILDTNAKAEKIFYLGAKNAESTDLKKYFKGKASEKKIFCKELRKELEAIVQKTIEQGNIRSSNISRE